MFPREGLNGPMPSRVTVSIGIAAAGRPGWDLARFYSLADQALYAAKQNGRDSVWVVSMNQAPDLEPRPSAEVCAPAASGAADAARR